ncbi:MAG: response regulator transcription factor [Chromatiales bacterium]|nr:response regulator transcription factor [Chromatiales bacterium]
MIRLVIAEDHTLVRDGLRLLLSVQPDMTLLAETGSGAAVVDLVRAHVPDVLLLDLGLPDVDGLAVMQALARMDQERCSGDPACEASGSGGERPTTRVLVVTARLDAAAVRDSLALGAAGYLTKGENSEVLLAAIRAVAAGGCHVSPQLVARLDMTADGALTAREQEILALVAGGLPSRAIAERLGLTERTVRKHRENIGRKIGACNAAEMTAFAIRNGLLGH